MTLKYFYLDIPLFAQTMAVLPTNLGHRLTRVLRLKPGACFAVFNGRDGLFEAELVSEKHLQVKQLLAEQPAAKPLVLALCLPKRDALDTVLRMATELGVSAIYPLVSKHAVVDKMNDERVHGRLVEAAEQCERLTIPTVHALQPLDKWLDSQKTPFAWCYERHAGMAVDGGVGEPLACALVGPEGGFSADEVAALRKHAYAHLWPLAEHVLRVETACAAALAQLNLCLER